MGEQERATKHSQASDMINDNSGANAHAATDAPHSPLEQLVAACQAGDITGSLALLALPSSASFMDAVGASGDTPLMTACRHGHLALVKTLLELGVDVSATKAMGATALHIAAQSDNQDIVAALLAHGANIEAATTDNQTPLHAATWADRTNVVDMLLAQHANANAVTREGWTILHLAAGGGRRNVLNLLLERGFAVNVRDFTGATPLWCAAQYGHVDIVTTLLARDASIEAANERGWTPLHIASGNGHRPVVEALLASGANIEALDVGRGTPLCWAAHYGRTEAVRALIAHGADVHTADANGIAPLIAATNEGHTDTVAALLPHVSDIDAANAEGMTALLYAASKGHQAIVLQLLEHSAFVDAADVNSGTPLVFACQEGHEEIVAALLLYGASVNMACANAITPLHVAAVNGHQSVVGHLLEYGASVDVVDGKGRTPLHSAAQFGHSAILAALLPFTTSVEAQNKNGMTPLHLAARNGHVEVVKLLASVTHVDAISGAGFLPLHYAATFGHQDVVVELLDRGANRDAIAADVGTPLHGAVRGSHHGAMMELLQRGADLSIANTNGWTPLHFATDGGNVAIVLAILSYGQVVDARTVDGSTPLHIAAQHDNAAVVQALLAHGASVDAKTLTGLTALQFAADQGHVDVVATLLAHDADPNASDSCGYTALHHASSNNHGAVVAQLLAAGAAIDVATAEGATPLFFAASNGHARVVQTLLAHGADSHAAHDRWGTPLHGACSRGHVDVVSVLLNECARRSSSAAAAFDDAAVKVKSGANAAEKTANGGCHPAAGGVSHADPDGEAAASPPAQDHTLLEAVNPVGDTPLLMAAKCGHFGLVRTLIQAGASASARSRDSSTVLVLAAWFRNLKIVSELSALGLLAPVTRTENGQASLLLATLQALGELAERTHEFQVMWMRVVDRLNEVHNVLASTPDPSHENVFQFVMIVFQFVRIGPACSPRITIMRLVACQAVAAKLRDCHTELSFLEQSLCLASDAHTPIDWNEQCENDEIELLRCFRAAIEQSDVSAWGLRTQREHTAAVSLLQHKLRAQRSTCSPELLKLLELALEKLQGTSSAQSSAPRWFIPPYELDFDNLVRGSSLSVGAASPPIAQGKWLSSVIMASEYAMEREAFTAAVERCFHLSHPNVLKVFGASHLNAPFVAVYERASSTHLREYLMRDENKHARWQKVHEAALGLKYLLERGIAIRHLRCEDIWIGMDGVAKINVLGCLVSPDLSTSDSFELARWQAPEVIQGEGSTMASSVYSLSMCIAEVVTGKDPWRDDGFDSAFDPSTVTRGFRPTTLEGLSEAQQYLVTRMWRTDPAQRPTIASVILELKQFADKSDTDRKQQTGPRDATALSQLGRGSLALDSFEFFDLGTTLPTFLERLERKCSHCHESIDAAQHIHQRLQGVYTLMTTQHRPPHDVAVVSYCELLERFNRFLGNAVTPKSVLLRAKSQKVSLQSNVFHRRLDELLEVLGAARACSIHAWSGQSIASDTHSSMEEDESTALDEVVEGAPVSEGTAAATPASVLARPVKIVRFETDRRDERFDDPDAAVPQSTTSSKDAKPQWLIRTHELTYNSSDQIGVGAFGEVYRAKWLNTPAVVKFMGYEADSDAYSRAMFFHELRVWFPLKHPHVVELYGACHVGKRFFVCEFAGHGTLDKYLKKNEHNARRCWQLLYQVGLGLQHLHEQNVLHNDLKCDNVLIGAGEDAKITDFGLSSILNVAEVKIDPKKQGAVQWRSPEYLRGDVRLTLASDIYAFAMLIIEAVTGEPPWGRSTLDPVVKYRVKKGSLPLKPASLSAQQWRLIQMMCVADPAQRVTIAYVVDKLYELWHQHEAAETMQEARLDDSAAP